MRSVIGDGGVLNGALAPLGLLIVIPILCFPLVTLFAVQGILWLLRRTGVSTWEYSPEGWALVAWWIGGLLVLGWLRDAHFPPGFW